MIEKLFDNVINVFFPKEVIDNIKEHDLIKYNANPENWVKLLNEAKKGNDAILSFGEDGIKVSVEGLNLIKAFPLALVRMAHIISRTKVLALNESNLDNDGNVIVDD
jgi:hypothetical protein